MSLRFQADADLNQAILLGILRKEPGIDFQTAHQAQLAGLIDSKVLSVASRQGRILVTHDQKTMPLHFARFIATQISPGVLIIPQHLPVSSAIEELILIWSATVAEEWINRICYLPV